MDASCLSWLGGGESTCPFMTSKKGGDTRAFTMLTAGTLRHMETTASESWFCAVCECGSPSVLAWGDAMLGRSVRYQSTYIITAVLPKDVLGAEC
jgi:hypothetical protein